MSKARHRSVPSKDDYYMGLCLLIAGKSKDPHTQHGAIIVKDNIPLGMGYNGPPKQISDTLVNWERVSKLQYCLHAEDNALRHSRAGRSDFDGATAYVSGFTCCKCALGIITVGIKKVIYGPRSSRSISEEDKKAVVENYRLANVDYIYYRGYGKLNWLRDLVYSLSEEFPQHF